MDRESGSRRQLNPRYVGAVWIVARVCPAKILALTRASHLVWMSAQVLARQARLSFFPLFLRQIVGETRAADLLAYILARPQRPRFGWADLGSNQTATQSFSRIRRTHASYTIAFLRVTSITFQGWIAPAAAASS